MKIEHLQRVTRTMVPPIKSGTESEPVDADTADAYYDPTRNQYFGVTEIPDSGKSGDTKQVLTGPYGMSSDIPPREMMPNPNK
jgi:hypothetical protein